MSDPMEGPFFILLKKKQGQQRSYSNISKTHQNKLPIEVLAGTLLCFVQDFYAHGRLKFELETLEEDLEDTYSEQKSSVQVVCIPGEEICSLSELVLQLLRPIPTCRERLEVFSDESWLNDGIKLKVGDQVFVKLKGELSEISGKLCFKGVATPSSKSILFGIELEENKGKCDGWYEGKQYFRCKPDRGVFVPLHKIRRHKDGWQMKTRMRAEMEGEKLPQAQKSASGNPPLQLGERIVWISDNGPERGEVKWTGCLPGDNSSNIFVGVEFDRKVGSGTGKYKDERLFFAKQGHASLIPLMGLMKESAFEGPGAYNDEPVDEKLFVDLDKFGSTSRQKTQDLAASHSADSWSKASNYQTAVDCNQKAMGVNGETRGASSAPAMAHVTGGLGAGVGHQDYLLSQQFAKLSAFSSGGVGASGGANVHKGMQDQSVHPGAASQQSKPAAKPSQIPDPDLGLGSHVQVQLKVPLYGIIRWIGHTDAQSEKKTAGLEMEEELSAGTDGVYRSVRYFTCPPKKGLFVPLYRCSKDKRYKSSDFGGQLTPDIPGDISPPEVDETLSALGAVCGKNRGIQGHHNSCYLDATLFSMFYFTTVFDFIFNRPANEDDLPEYCEVQRVLKEGIVNPLRKFNYVRADKVLKLRELLDKLGTVPGMMGEEKDPEEFLNALLTQIMKADPLLQLSSGQHAYFYQLFIEEDKKLLLPTTQKLVELSFLQGNVKLKEAPPCLMIQMPRFGKDYKMFHRIVPSLELDITHIVENCPRDCIVCGGLARYECKDCYQVHGPGLNTTAFCQACMSKSHQHMMRRDHTPELIKTTGDFPSYYEESKKQHELWLRQQGLSDKAIADTLDTIPLPRETMELFAVICIQTSHYVSFVKCGSGKNAPWVFFDSMADRMGEQGGYNIPEVVHVPMFAEWLDKNSLRDLHKNTDDRELPEHLRRVLCDGYMCLYQSSSIVMYQ